jgi:hypothetical protein
MAYGVSSRFQIERTEKKSEARNAIILEFKMTVLDLAMFRCQVQISIADIEIPREIWPCFGEQRKSAISIPLKNEQKKVSFSNAELPCASHGGYQQLEHRDCPCHMFVWHDHMAVDATGCLLTDK